MSAEKRFQVTFVCGFCGSVEQRDMPVDLKLKRWPACQRCLPGKPRKGMTVKYLAPERLPDHAFYDTVLTYGAIYTVQKFDQWQHGCTLTLHDVKPSCEIKGFTPATYEPTDYHKLRLKLRALGALFKGFIGEVKETDRMRAAVYEAWEMDGRGLIVAHDSDTVGLYDFVGELDAPVECDLSYLEKRKEAHGKSA